LELLPFTKGENDFNPLLRKRRVREDLVFSYPPDITEFAAGEHPQAYDLSHPPLLKPATKLNPFALSMPVLSLSKGRRVERC
jgi:hypothetical protein